MNWWERSPTRQQKKTWRRRLSRARHTKNRGRFVQRVLPPHEAERHIVDSIMLRRVDPFWRERAPNYYGVPDVAEGFRAMERGEIDPMADATAGAPPVQQTPGDAASTVPGCS